LERYIMGFGHLVVGITGDEIADVDVEVESSLAISVVNGYEPSSPSHNSSSGSSVEPVLEPVEDVAESCQCTHTTCSVCSSLVEHGTYCPQLCGVIIIEDD
jgi:hypothetical protein